MQSARPYEIYALWEQSYSLLLHIWAPNYARLSEPPDFHSRFHVEDQHLSTLYDEEDTLVYHRLGVGEFVRTCLRAHLRILNELAFLHCQLGDILHRVHH